MKKPPSLKKSFYLSQEMISNTLIKENISTSLLCNDNFYMLVLSTLMICIGLDKGSHTIIIGGMVITPILGSIFSLAYGLATKDTTIAPNATYNYLGCIFIGLIVSTLYFILTPSAPPNALMLSIVSLSYHAILISIVGGVTITLGFLYNQKLLPFIGTSIATTLAPPLCMMGYGIRQFSLALLYLAARVFFLNSFFIFLPCVLLFYILLKHNKNA